MRKIWPTPGGVHPPEHKAQSLENPLVELPLPGEIVLPVSQHLGTPAEPTVNVGDQVLKGQLIAAGKQLISANIHASTSGKVTAIEERPLAHPSGLNGLCIVITPDGDDRWTALSPLPDYTTKDPSDLLDKIQAAGVVGMGGAGFPTSVKLSSSAAITTLIINGTECEPYITSDDILMQTSADDIIRGVQMLDYILGKPEEVLIGIEENKPAAIAAMENAITLLGESRFEVVPLPVKYPSGGEKQLVQMLTGREVPAGRLPAHVGAVCQNVATTLAAYRAVVFGEPLISRITTITGDAFSDQRNISVRFGTPIKFILEKHGYQAERASRLVMGGPMMGFTLLNSDAPIVKTTNCLLAPSREEAPDTMPAQACIRCGMCAEACPASLLPQQLYWYARAEDDEKLKAYNLFDCIECGACSYVCPSNIPLVQYYRAAKGSIRHHEQEKQQAARARERFEFHKERIEQEKTERAKAREEAAAKAKQRAELKKAAPEENTKQKLATEIIAQAKQAQTEDPARLERNIISTQDRLAKLQAKVAELEVSAPEQADAIRARIKETELKLTSLRAKQSEAAEKNDDKKTEGSPASSLAEKTEKSSEGTAPLIATDTSVAIANADTVVAQAEKIAEKLTLSGDEQQTRQIKILQTKLEKVQAQMASADPEDADTISALTLSENVLTEKLKTAQDSTLRSAAATTKSAPDLSPAEKSAVSDAIALSMEKAMATGSSATGDELAKRLDSIKNRVTATEIKLAGGGDEKTRKALQSALENLNATLAQAERELTESDDSSST